MLFWTNICTEEATKAKMNQSQNIIGQYKDSLLPIIYRGLSLTEFDDNDMETEDTTDDI